MVKLSLSSTKGNGARYFPHVGYLALTPLKVEGIVRTRLDDDRKPILASDITVAIRCYEARIGRTGITHSNLLVDHHVPLWTKPPDEAWAALGDGDWPFRLVLPPKLAGHSTANFQEYRIFWRVEAVLNHIPMMGVGHRQIKTYDLPLMRYDPGEPLPFPPSEWSFAGPSKHPRLRYVIDTPRLPLGPMDLVPISLKLVPARPQARVHSIALAVERRLEFNNNPPCGTRAGVDEVSLSSSTNLIDRHPPPPSPKGPTPKVTTFLVTSAETSDVPQDQNGIYVRTLTLQVPTPKSAGHWAVGETLRTVLVTLRFFLLVKVTLAMPNGTLETLELGERELCLISSNESERRVAMAKYSDALERAQGRDTTRLPSPPLSPIDGLSPMGGMIHGKGSAKGKGVARRPHTSTGSRDSPREVVRGAARRAGTTQSMRDGRQRVVRPPSSVEREREREQREDVIVPNETGHVRAWEDDRERIEARGYIPTWERSPTMRSAPAEQSYFASLPPSLPPLSPSSPAAADSVQAWEEELERIAAQSRRRSVEMLGFNSDRRTRPRIEVTGLGAKLD